MESQATKRARSSVPPPPPAARRVATGPDGPNRSSGDAAALTVYRYWPSNASETTAYIVRHRRHIGDSSDGAAARGDPGGQVTVISPGRARPALLHRGRSSPHGNRGCSETDDRAGRCHGSSTAIEDGNLKLERRVAVARGYFRCLFDGASR